MINFLANEEPHRANEELQREFEPDFRANEAAKRAEKVLILPSEHNKMA